MTRVLALMGGTPKAKAITAILVAIVFLLIGTSITIYRSFAAIPEMFRLNSQLRAEGYYMGEFEFKMVGIIYYLDKGDYMTAFSRFTQLHNQLKSREGLVKIPQFADKKEELSFYLNRQNPRTGAFMDDSYPLCTYVGSTLNVINHLEALAIETGQPLHLEYPLWFLDQINTGEKLKAYLDDLATVGWIASKLPKTHNILAFEILYYRDIERVHLYTFSPEWKHALLQWFYENQDRETGCWGPRLRSNGQLLNSGDDSTYHVARWFLDDQGNDRYPEFPFRYKDALFATTLRQLSTPLPTDFATQHAWVLTQDRGIKVLANLLWPSASPENKSSARKLMEEHVRTKFEKYYVQSQGAFSLYPGSTQADLDGTGLDLSLLQTVGALSREKQERLWGPPDKNIKDLGTHKVSKLKESDFTAIIDSPEVNSLRFYRSDPTHSDLLSNVVCVTYPKETPILDMMDLLPKLVHWVNTTPQNMGNWVSKESLIQDLSPIKAEPVPVFKGLIPPDVANEVLQSHRELVVVGYDILQIPRYKIVFKLES